jgi:hypothetical protein
MSNTQRPRRRYPRGDYLSPLLDAHAAGHLRPGTLTVAEMRFCRSCNSPLGAGGCCPACGRPEIPGAVG